MRVHRILKVWSLLTTKIIISPKQVPINTTVNLSPIIRRRKTYDSSSVRPTNVYRTIAYYQPKTEIGKLTKNFPKTSHSSTGEKSTNNRHSMSVFGPKNLQLKFSKFLSKRCFLKILYKLFFIYLNELFIYITTSHYTNSCVFR